MYNRHHSKRYDYQKNLSYAIMEPQVFFHFGELDDMYYPTGPKDF